MVRLWKQAQSLTLRARFLPSILERDLQMERQDGLDDLYRRNSHGVVLLRTGLILGAHKLNAPCEKQFTDYWPRYSVVEIAKPGRRRLLLRWDDAFTGTASAGSNPRR